MKTEYFKSKSKRISDPKIGQILFEINQLSLKKEFFAIMGISYDGIAITKLFEQIDMSPVSESRCYQLCHKVRHYRDNLIVQTPLYADLSRLIVRELSSIIPILNEGPACITGIIHKRDIRQMIRAMLEINTISQDTKNTYLEAIT